MSTTGEKKQYLVLDLLLGILSFIWLLSASQASEPQNLQKETEFSPITVYKSPSCGCCEKWVEHLRHEGFQVETQDMASLDMIKNMSGISPQLASCHTALVEGYTIEGHVPAADK